MDVTPDMVTLCLTIKNIDDDIDKAAEEHTALVKLVLTLAEAEGLPKEDMFASDPRFGENTVHKNNDRIKQGYYAATAAKVTIKDLSKYAPSGNPSSRCRASRSIGRSSSIASGLSSRMRPANGR